MNLSEKLKTFISGKQIGNIKTDGYTRDKNLYPAMKKILEATTVNTPFGEHFIVEKNYKSSHIHGEIKLDSVFNISPEILKLIAKNGVFESFDFSRAIFIDTETTGLAGGTGTLAFLIGVGYFEGNDFRITQYFISDYDEESAALYSLSGLLENFDSMVSFNGKSFDIPLLSTRYMLNRIENPLEKTFHLDLLACARRLYRERLESVSLSSLEINLLSLEREGDIPGYEIPSVYFKFLRDKNPYPIKPIFYHNRMDILSMVTLTANMAKSFKAPFDSKNCANQDYYCLGRIFEDMGMIERSIECYEKALNVLGVREKSYKQLSLLYKRLDRWQEAEKLWIDMAKSNINTVFALVELAKYYEHKIKDYDKAAQVTQKALETVYKKRTFVGHSLNDELVELKKRLERIKCKREKHQFQSIIEEAN
ncbi:MAG: ribonuclease H-like domain-containing protein [Tepidanaerobacteraceae bacterium]